MLKEQVAIVTGASRGIGEGIARALAQANATVVGTSTSAKGAEGISKMLAEAGARGAGRVLDVRDAAACSAFVEKVQEEFGPVAILVNNAGVTRDATIVEVSEADWDLVIDVHLKGTFLCTRAIAPRMRDAGRGAIVNISSISGKIGNIGQANYSSAKAGMVALTKVTAREYARYGVRANAIQPGLIGTPPTLERGEEKLRQGAADTPMGRIGTPAEVASVALFLASDLASFVTGAVIEATGGRHM
jgi:3-oxoacyl-[acyl-carrier protein] reductase